MEPPTFEDRIELVKENLSRILRINLSGKDRGSSIIYKSICGIERQWSQGRRNESEVNLTKLAYFCKHLGEIEGHSMDMLRQFRQGFRRAITSSQFHGLRFEVYVAASLLRKQIRFEKSEAPDFIIYQPSFCIECSSVRIDSPKQSDLSYKVASVIRKKMKSASHRPDVALFIDITNVFHNSPLEYINQIRPAAFKAVSESNFCSTILFLHQFNGDIGQYETAYLREDSPRIEPQFKSLLDLHYPVGSHKVYNFHIPAEG